METPRPQCSLHPEFEAMLSASGDLRLQALARVLVETSPEVSVRVNSTKSAGKEPDLMLAEPVAWCQGGWYLADRPKFTLDPAMHQGRYYVQDASSMIVKRVAADVAAMLAKDAAAEGAVDEAALAGGALPLLWLDACAAPGGKTTAALDGLPAGSLVVANEYDYGRAEILAENVAKWGGADTIVARGDTARFRPLGELFDVVAVDAPCSGEGMMRKDVTACRQWSPALVEECAARQREILANLWEVLRPGGVLVYSTCTFNATEDELMVDWLRREYGAESLDIAAASCAALGNAGELKIEGIAPTRGVRFIPGVTRGEGLFVALLRKPGRYIPAITRLADKKRGKEEKARRQSAKGAVPAVRPADFAGWLSAMTSERYALLASETGVRLFPRAWQPLLPQFQRHLDILTAGVEAVEVKGRDGVPSQALALSGLLAADAFPQVEVDRAMAIDYLAREAVTLPAETPRGYVLLTYGGLPLGFVKNLGNRANNLYPKEWRIRNK